MKEKLKLAPVSVAWKAGAYGISIEGAEADTFTAATTVTLKDGTEKKAQHQLSFLCGSTVL